MKRKTTPVQSIIRQSEAYGFVNFVESAKRYLKVLDPVSPDHVILKLLLTSAVGKENAKTWPKIAPYLRAKGIKMTKRRFQKDLLQLSRRSLFYIGSSQDGYFIFSKQSDVDATVKFYQDRIAKEEQHLGALQFLSSKANFSPAASEVFEEDPKNPAPPESQNPSSES